ncbi:MAG TPA: nuclear transport factor 2 family protein [Candidatus Elarobacter sp.]|nr:nuclear transport factor 2 family protein [Candidatus Elarobacter sp.]
MRKRTSLLSLLLTAAFTAIPAAAQGPAAARPVREVVPAGASAADRAIADELIRLTRAQWAAEEAKDVAAEFRNVAPDYTEFNADYATRIEGRDMAMRIGAGTNKDAGRRIVDEMANPLVQVFGNTAILSYNFVGSTIDKDGKTTATRAKSTRVYVRQGNEWMLVHANFAADPLPK